VLTVKQAAERLGVSAALVYALCAAGRIRHERYGLGRGTIRISAEAMEEYRAASRVERAGPGAANGQGLKHIKL
jgi:excisionase family DNA binding protein